MLNGLSLFSGIGGLDVALLDYVRAIAYCEIDSYCQGMLFSRMADDSIDKAPIWSDIRTLQGVFIAPEIDIIYGGFPCQDISIAGHGKGLAGERSGLFFEIVRLAKEIKPKFIFLENVPAITSRGGLTVVRSIAEMGYDCRWCVISAASVGALHRRERWFLLGYSQHNGSYGIEKRGSTKASVHSCEKGQNETSQFERASSSKVLASESMADSGFMCERCEDESKRSSFHDPRCCRFWETEPDVDRVADGIPQRVERIRALGNAVVPKQAKEAFQILMGLK